MINLYLDAMRVFFILAGFALVVCGAFSLGGPVTVAVGLLWAGLVAFGGALCCSELKTLR